MLTYFDEHFGLPRPRTPLWPYALLITLMLLLYAWAFAMAGGGFHKAPKAPYATPYCNTERGSFAQCQVDPAGTDL